MSWRSPAVRRLRIRGTISQNLLRCFFCSYACLSACFCACGWAGWFCGLPRKVVPIRFAALLFSLLPHSRLPLFGASFACIGTLLGGLFRLRAAARLRPFERGWVNSAEAFVWRGSPCAVSRRPIWLQSRLFLSLLFGTRAVFPYAIKQISSFLRKRKFILEKDRGL